MADHPKSLPRDLQGIDPATLAKAQEDYAKALGRIKAIARKFFAHYTDPGRRDDAVQNTIGMGWRNWLSAIRHGHDPNKFVTRLATFSAQAVRSGNVVWREEPLNDVMSPKCHHQRGVDVQQLDDALLPSDLDLDRDPHGQQEVEGRQEVLHDRSQTPPGKKARVGYLDLPTWMDQQTDRDRAIAQALAEDHTPTEISRLHGVHPSRIRQIKADFRRSWKQMHGEDEVER